MVKKVFTTLAKVPFYIAILYLIANIVLFAVFYFRALGISYVVMQTAVENNYIPANEASAIKNTLNSYNSVSDGGQSGGMRVPVASQYAVYINTSDTIMTAETLYYNGVTINSNGLTSTSVNNRRQYGNQITVGVGYCYTAILPLADGSILDYTSNFVTTPVMITYKVPGLKYYPDKLTTD